MLMLRDGRVVVPGRPVQAPIAQSIFVSAVQWKRCLF